MICLALSGVLIIIRPVIEISQFYLFIAPFDIIKWNLMGEQKSVDR